MTPTELLQLERNIAGVWLLPEEDGRRAVLKLDADRGLFMRIAALSMGQRVMQLIRGDVMIGSWLIQPRLRRSAVTSSSIASVRLTATSSSFGARVKEPKLGTPNPNSSVFEGPFLILNFTDEPKAVARLSPFGLHLHISNWFLMLNELAGGFCFRIHDWSRIEEELVVGTYDDSQVWRRADAKVREMVEKAVD
jgi:hypothetical protein